MPFAENKFQTPEELEATLGASLKALRLDRNITQAALAERADVSLKAIKNLENGQGSTIKTMVCVLRALGRESWLQSVAPVASINPLTMTRQAEPRQRARVKKTKA
jgi:transcriptional regulator with XRE-family HTH domain